jgi:formate hydrogenlyase subunit 4
MSVETAIAGVIQIAGGVAIAPLVPGSVQTLKARLQGRRGPSPLQPYRELRRLWGKSTVQPEDAGPVYALAPAVAAAALAACLVVITIAGLSPNWPFGNDALLIVGLFALARFAVATASWDTGSGFALMGAARDLAFAVVVEGLFLGVIVLAALPGGSTDLVSLSATANGWDIWSEPVHWCAAAAFALVLIAETGRQPVDNPDTHLELTMVHEGGLLEYAGRDQAMLQWTMAARHWVLAILGAELFLPHVGGFGWRLLELALGVALVCVALALTETWVAKMRILRVPRLVATGMALCIVGVVLWFAGGAA